MWPCLEKGNRNWPQVRTINSLIQSRHILVNEYTEIIAVVNVCESSSHVISEMLDESGSSY